MVVSVAATASRSRRGARRTAARRMPPGWPTAAGIVAGAVADALLGDPRRGHPVALFGRAALAAQARAYADSRVRGTGYAAGCVLAVAAAWRVVRLARAVTIAATGAAAVATAVTEVIGERER